MGIEASLGRWERTVHRAKTIQHVLLRIIYSATVRDRSLTLTDDAFREPQARWLEGFVFPIYKSCQRKLREIFCEGNPYGFHKKWRVCIVSAIEHESGGLVLSMHVMVGKGEVPNIDIPCDRDQRWLGLGKNSYLLHFAKKNRDRPWSLESLDYQVHILEEREEDRDTLERWKEERECTDLQGRVSQFQVPRDCIIHHVSENVGQKKLKADDRRESEEGRGDAHRTTIWIWWDFNLRACSMSARQNGIHSSGLFLEHLRCRTMIRIYLMIGRGRMMTELAQRFPKRRDFVVAANAE